MLRTRTVYDHRMLYMTYGVFFCISIQQFYCLSTWFIEVPLNLPNTGVFLRWLRDGWVPGTGEMNNYSTKANETLFSVDITNRTGCSVRCGNAPVSLACAFCCQGEENKNHLGGCHWTGH